MRYRFESALRESNPPVQLGRLTPLPIGQEHAAEGEGVEPSRLIARLFSKQLPSPIGLPFRIAFAKAAAAGIEPAKGRLTGACLYQHRPHRNESGWQDLNLRSQAPRACAMPGFATPCRSQGGRIRTDALLLPTQADSKLSHTLKLKCPAGVEPALPPWQGSRLPLHHGRVESLVELSKIRAPGGTRTHVAALRVRSPRRWTTSAFHSVGSEGLEPSPTWLRARHAAANTLIPCSCFASRCSVCAHSRARRESNPRPGPYKRPALNH